MSRFESDVAAEQPEIAVIAIPGEGAQEVLDRIVRTGIKAVLNFAPVPLNSRKGVKVKTVDLTTSLESLSYFLAQPPASRVTHKRGQHRDNDDTVWMNKQPGAN